MNPAIRSRKRLDVRMDTTVAAANDNMSEKNAVVPDRRWILDPFLESRATAIAAMPREPRTMCIRVSAAIPRQSDA